MKKKIPPEKLPDVLKKIKECISSEKYAFTKHALDRVQERGIDIPTTIYVLLNGNEDKQKTRFDKDINAWKYAIRGKTIENLDVRVILAIDEYEMVIITVMHVARKL